MINGLHPKYYRKNLFLKPLLWGIFSSIILFSLYLTILTIANSFEHAIEQFKHLWLLMSLLIIGFGVQIGLFSYVKNAAKIKAAKYSTIYASAGISSASMIACCAHHVTDIIPILGISAATIFISKYQTLFLLIGILSNLAGLWFMLRLIKNKQLFHKNQRIMPKIMGLNINWFFYVTITSIVVVGIIKYIYN